MMRPLILGLVFATALSAADFTGIWVGSYPGRNPGDVIDMAFKFVQQGEKLYGKQYGDYLSMPIIEGKVTGDQVSFVVIVQEQAGNEINNTRVQFTGTLKDGVLEIVRERASSQRAGSGADVQFRGNAKVNFPLRKLL